MRLIAAMLLALACASAAFGASKKEAYALELEKHMLRTGIDATIRANETTLTVTSALMDRPAVFQLIEGNFLVNAKRQGFREVVFSDGAQNVWRYDVDTKAAIP